MSHNKAYGSCDNFRCKCIRLGLCLYAGNEWENRNANNTPAKRDKTIERGFFGQQFQHLHTFIAIIKTKMREGVLLFVAIHTDSQIRMQIGTEPRHNFKQIAYMTYSIWYVRSV